MNILAVTSYLIDQLGRIKGKKAFQKLIYLSKAVGIPLEVNYKMYYYGPYSEQVSDELEECINCNILKEEGAYNFISSDKCQETLILNNDQITIHKEKLEFIVNKFGCYDPMELEILATTHFVYNNMKYLHGEERKEIIVEEVKKVKYPKFSCERIEDAYNTLKSYSLIS